MNSLFGRSRVVAAAVCGIALAACNAITDVDPKPAIPTPAQQANLGGTVSGLGSRRPVFLMNNGDAANAQPFFGIAGQNSVLFTFGSLNVGSPYNIAVRTQPYGKICTVNNGTGTVGDVNAAPITVTCVNDPAVARYKVQVTVNAAVSSIAGLKVRLTTEEGVIDMPGTGSGNVTVTFPNVLFNAGASPPTFLYYVSAYIPDANGTTTDNCLVTNNSNDNGTGNSPNPTADVTNPVVTACKFTVGGTVGYSQPAGVTYTTQQTISGLQLGLKDMTGTTVYTYNVPTVGPIAAPGTLTTAFTWADPTTLQPAQFVSNSAALYEMYVTKQPTSGQYCIVSNTAASPGNGNGSIVNLVTTASAAAGFTNVTNLAVRCRALPGTATNPGTALNGVFRTTGMTSVNQTVVTTGTAPQTKTTTSTTTITAGTQNPGGIGTTTTVNSVIVDNTVTPATTTSSTTVTTLATQQDDRRYLALFSDGTFIYGVHSSASFNSDTSNNLEHGFYYYNPTANTIAFTIITDANGATAISPANTAGFSDVPNYTAPVATATNVVKVAKTSTTAPSLQMWFCTDCSATSVKIQKWYMTEPEQDYGTMTGAWVTPDHERLFVYNFTDTSGFHVGTNGQDNMQDGCYVYDDPTTTSGYYVRRGGGTATDPNNPFVTNCNLGANLATASSPDLPNTSGSVPGLIPGFIGRLPGSKSVIDNHPASPAVFKITAGSADQSTPDQLTLQSTLNGALIDYPVTFVRFVAQ
ncbi:MAG TPA: hypothetical protein VMI92_12310 [Steroidobacteraceae bacterium]|nr:hypothetical protein [Steroidobacteraceae bacterium]